LEVTHDHLGSLCSILNCRANAVSMC
jgi:hypothetical protein